MLISKRDTLPANISVGSLNRYSAVAILYCCSLMHIVLVWFMVRHMSGIRDRREAARNWGAALRRSSAIIVGTNLGNHQTFRCVAMLPTLTSIAS